MNHDNALEKALNDLMKEYIKKNKGPCLIPKPGVCALSCHENDFCACNIEDAFQAGAAFERARILGMLRDPTGMRDLKPTICEEIADWLESQLGSGNKTEEV